MDQARRDCQQEDRELAECRSATGLADDGEADEQRQVLPEFGQERGKDEGRERAAGAENWR